MQAKSQFVVISKENRRCGMWKRGKITMYCDLRGALPQKIRKQLKNWRVLLVNTDIVFTFANKLSELAYMRTMHTYWWWHPLQCEQS